MRTFLILSLSLTTPLLAACGNDKKPDPEGVVAGNTAPPVAGMDAVTHPMPDSGTPTGAMDAAMGGDDSGSADAGPVDAGPLPVTHPRRFILADEPLRKILLVDLDHPENDWDTDVPGGARDLQLIGNGRVMVSTLEGSGSHPGGYHEVDIATGEIKESHVDFGGVSSTYRLKNGNTWITGTNLGGKSGTVIIEVDHNDAIKKTWDFPGYGGLRLMRPTAQGHFMFGTSKNAQPDNDRWVEFDPDTRAEVWSVLAGGWPAYMGLRLPNGDTVIANGHGLTLKVFDSAMHEKQEIGGPNSPDDAVAMSFHPSQFQILRNHHYVIANWQGHDANKHGKGKQVVEYDTDGKLVWYWEQDDTRIAGVHGIVVLDGLDLQKLHDDSKGILGPVE